MISSYYGQYELILINIGKIFPDWKSVITDIKQY